MPSVSPCSWEPVAWYVFSPWEYCEFLFVTSTVVQFTKLCQSEHFARLTVASKRTDDHTYQGSLFSSINIQFFSDIFRCFLKPLFWFNVYVCRTVNKSESIVCPNLKVWDEIEVMSRTFFQMQSEIFEFTILFLEICFKRFHNPNEALKVF